MTTNESAECAVVDPRRLVNLGLRLHRREGRSCDDVLAALDAGLDRWPRDGNEIAFGSALWTRALCLDELGRRREAKVAAEQYVETGLTALRADAEQYLARWQE